MAQTGEHGLKKDAIGFSDGLTIGVVLLFAWRRHRREPFFLRLREVAPPGLLEASPTDGTGGRPALAEAE